MVIVGFQVTLGITKIFTRYSETKDKKDYHLVRRLNHVFTGILLVYCNKILKNVNLTIFFIFLGFALLATIDFVRKRSLFVNKLFLKLFSDMIRKEEIETKPFASIYFMLGCCLCFVFFKVDIACLAVLFLSFGDPLASLAGIKYGQKKIYGDKSYLGNAVCALTCGLITILYPQLYYIEDINITTIDYASKFMIGCFTGSLAELLPSKFFFDDNASIPLYSGSILTGIHYLLLTINK